MYYFFLLELGEEINRQLYMIQHFDFLYSSYCGTSNTAKSCTEYSQNICSVLLTVNIPSWGQIILWLLKIGVKMSQSSGQAEIQIGLDHQKPKARKIDPTFQVMIGCEAKKITEECSMSQRCRGINGYIVQKKFRLLKNNHKNKSLDFLSYYYNTKLSGP